MNGTTVTGTLYVVPTPIGDVGDLSVRARAVLGSVDAIAAEDTRVTRALLRRAELRVPPLLSLHDHNEEQRTPSVLARLRDGQSIALVSDGGTPVIRDPGYRLLRAALEADVAVVVLPGPCAAITALVASGLPADQFRFVGFLPRAAGPLRAALEALADAPETWVAYESPRRLLVTLALVDEVLGSRPIAVARELTKVHEEVLRGTAAEVRAALAERDAVLGEIALVVGGAPPQPRGALDPEVVALVHGLVDAGVSPPAIRDAVSGALGAPRRAVYQEALARRGST